MTTEKSPAKAELTRERIFTAAISLFRQHGFEQTTMREVAAEAGVALGGAYYYFGSKESLVMAFYEKSQREMEPLLQDALKTHKDLDKRLAAMLQIKFDYFAEYRVLLGALSAHSDPRHALSPFSEQTAPIREHDIDLFAAALKGSDVRVPADLAPYLPRVLWLYQMGLILFWVYDNSPDQQRTRILVERSLRIAVNLIRFSAFPLLRPVRRQAAELMAAVYE